MKAVDIPVFWSSQIPNFILSVNPKFQIRKTKYFCHLVPLRYVEAEKQIAVKVRVRSLCLSASSGKDMPQVLVPAKLLLFSLSNSVSRKMHRNSNEGYLACLVYNLSAVDGKP